MCVWVGGWVGARICVRMWICWSEMHRPLSLCAIFAFDSVNWSTASLFASFLTFFRIRTSRDALVRLIMTRRAPMVLQTVLVMNLFSSLPSCPTPLGMLTECMHAPLERVHERSKQQVPAYRSVVGTRGSHANELGPVHLQSNAEFHHLYVLVLNFVHFHPTITSREETGQRQQTKEKHTGRQQENGNMTLSTC